MMPRLEDFNSFIQKTNTGDPDKGFRVVVELKGKCKECGNKTIIKTWYFSLDEREAEKQ